MNNMYASLTPISSSISANADDSDVIEPKLVSSHTEG